MEIFKNRLLIIASMHDKETVISPILEKELKVKTYVPKDLNTDSFGTFSREIPRKGTQIEALRSKILYALKITGEELGVGNEGSFGPDPFIPFVALEYEITMLIDLKNNLEIIGESYSNKTNYNSKSIATWDEALAFGNLVGFPQHGLIVTKKRRFRKDLIIAKGINNLTKFENLIKESLSQHREVTIETDMRANFNPTRMKNIKESTLDLGKNIKSLCPNCNTPGFTIVDRIKGLECENCGNPTNEIKLNIYTCKKCGIVNKEEVNSKASIESCKFCNP